MKNQPGGFERAATLKPVAPVSTKSRLLRELMLQCRDDDSYVQADSSSRYQHDPQFGGKISLSGYQGAKSDSPSSPQPLPPMPPDHPRVRELIGSEAVAR